MSATPTGVVMRVEFPLPDLTLNMNQRLHWTKQRRRARNWRHAAKLHACQQLGAGSDARRREPCLIRVSFPVRAPRQRRDPHNWAPTIKPIVDGLVDAGVWPDDNDQWVSVLDPRFHAYTPAAAAPYGLVIVELFERAGAIPE